MAGEVARILTKGRTVSRGMRTLQSQMSGELSHGGTVREY